VLIGRFNLLALGHVTLFLDLGKLLSLLHLEIIKLILGTSLSGLCCLLLSLLSGLGKVVLSSSCFLNVLSEVPAMHKELPLILVLLHFAIRILVSVFVIIAFRIVLPDRVID